MVKHHVRLNKGAEDTGGRMFWKLHCRVMALKVVGLRAELDSYLVMNENVNIYRNKPGELWVQRTFV